MRVTTHLKGQWLYDYWPLLFSVTLLLSFGWPGRMDFDSYHQYNSALSGHYSDHHPFITAFVWHYLDRLVSGPLFLFLYNIALLYTGIFFLIRSAPWSWRFWIAFLPFFPPVFALSFAVLKDVTYAFSFFCVLSVLAFLTVHEKPLRIRTMAPLFVVLLYGTMVKFQAQYVAPWILFWMSWHSLSYKHIARAIGKTVLLCLIFYGSIMTIQHLGPHVQKNHSWQSVKIFDLAGMSVSLGRIIIPKDIAGPLSIEKLTQAFEPWAVDPLWKVIAGCHTDAQRDVLLKTWHRETAQHPLTYLAHRARVFSQMVLPEKKIQHLEQRVSTVFSPHTFGYTCTMTLIAGAYFFLYTGPVLLCSLFFVWLAMSAWRSTKASIPLLFFNTVGLSMAAVLLVFSMAAVPRYLYITTCLCIFSIPFALLCYKNMRIEKRA